MSDVNEDETGEPTEEHDTLAEALTGDEETQEELDLGEDAT